MAKARKRKPPPKKSPPRAPKPRARPGLVVGVGLATVDLLCVAPRIDERLVELSIFSMQGGGSVATALATVATLGAKARLFGRLADDDFGRFVLGALRGLVDTLLVSVERGKISPVSLVNIDELTRKRKIMFTRGSTTALLDRKSTRL